MSSAAVHRPTGTWVGPVVDCDVHAVVPSIEALFPHMDEVWVDWIQERGFIGPSLLQEIYPPNATLTARPEWRPGDRVPASEPSLLREHLLDPWNVERALVNCYYAVEGVRHPDLNAALARAVNNWLIAEWLTDERLVASLVVPGRQPAAMIEEIRRVGDHPGFRQVLFPVRSDRLYGDRIYHPVYKEIEARDLVLGIHWGGITEGPPQTSGNPERFVEEYAAEWGNYAAHLTNMVAAGVFQACPNLRVSMLECGFTWIPVFLWRLDREWKGLHRETPWLNRRPFELVREHFRFSTAPTDAGPAEWMPKVIEWLGSDDLLMHASDYPHRHDSDVDDLLQAMPESMRQNVMGDTARRWYRL